jgi:hypothetical protein
MNIFKYKWFFTLTAIAVLLGCPAETSEGSAVLNINNLSDFNLLLISCSNYEVKYQKILDENKQLKHKILLLTVALYYEEMQQKE